MLVIKKSDRYAIDFIFDIESVNAALIAFLKVSNGKQVAEIADVQIDLGIFRSRNRRDKVINLLLKEGNNNLFYIKENKCILEIENNDIEWGIGLLQSYIQFGSFEVAEFTIVDIPHKNIKWSIHIYFQNKK